MGYLVFTDLDGTLLDHHGYSWEGARPALTELKNRRIPVVFVTSKTRSELLPFRKKLNNTSPFITENGGAVFFPQEAWPHPVAGSVQTDTFQMLVIGRRYGFIRGVFEKLQSRFPVRGFGDMTVAEIASLTGLDQDEAALAKEREFSEPFLLENKELEKKMMRAAADYDCKVIRGGRFYHLMGTNQDKGKAVAVLINEYRTHSGTCTAIGLGDSANDLPMLDRVDIPVLIAKPDGTFENYQAERLIRSRHPGSRGWGECIQEIIGQ